MADGGRYRQRRHAVYAAESNGLIGREPAPAALPALDYNPLHGGIERWFEPIERPVGDEPDTQRRSSRCCRSLFGELAPRDAVVADRSAPVSD